MHPNVPHHFDRRPTDYPRKKPPKYGWRDDNGKPIHEIAADGTPVCGRRGNSSKMPCQHKDRFLAANGRCCSFGHGGQATGSPMKHGRYSIFLPTRLAANYAEGRGDEMLSNVRDNIALVIAMIEDKLPGLGEESSAELWLKASTAHAEAVQAASNLIAELGPGSRRSRKGCRALLDRLDKLGRLLDNGKGLKQKEKEILDLMNVSGNLTRVELTRLEKMREFVTAEQLLANQALIMSVLKKHIEPSVLNKIGVELGRIAHV